jgi:hypothetical protein
MEARINSSLAILRKYSTCFSQQAAIVYAKFCRGGSTGIPITHDFFMIKKEAPVCMTSASIFLRFGIPSIHPSPPGTLIDRSMHSRPVQIYGSYFLPSQKSGRFVLSPGQRHSILPFRYAAG